VNSTEYDSPNVCTTTIPLMINYKTSKSPLETVDYIGKDMIPTLKNV